MIYITSATTSEIQLLINYCNTNFKKDKNGIFQINEDTQINIQIHGVGMLEASYFIQKYCAIKPTLIIQAGIAGAFNPQLNIGNVYCVGADRVADIGVQDNDQYLDAFELNLLNENEPPYSNGWLFNTEKPYPTFFAGLMHVNAITVNTASGNAKQIELWQTKYKPTIETMEGAALHFVCLKEDIPFIQVRAISNFVTPRNKALWNMPLAIERLNEVLIDYIKQLGTY